MSVSENNTYVKIPPQVYYTSEPQVGQRVVISNVNQKALPVTGIVVIEPSGQMHKVSRKHAVNRKLGKNGISVEFNLPKRTTISQIVLVINVWCPAGGNMHTASVSIRDKNKKVWENTQPLKWGEKYIDVYVQKPRIIHGPPQQILCNGRPNCTQENVLNEHLQENVWD